MEEQDSAPSSSRRKSLKRPKHVMSEDEDVDVSPPKRVKTVEDNLLNFDDEDDSPTTSRQRKPSKKAGSRSKKAVASDPESEDDYALEDETIAEDLGTLQDDDDDDDFVEEEQRKSTKGKGVAKGKGAKGGKGSKTKGEAEPKEIMFKDERQGSSLKRDPVVVDDNAPNSTKEKEPSPPPKKKKLPPIKKNKPSGSSAGSAASTTPKPTISTAKASGSISSAADGISLTPSTPVARVPAASTDFDLRDKNVYAMLLGGSSGSSSSSGLKRVKEEQRRKELNKLRDEARAKRAQEAKNSFDLQAHVDKILHFEERLRRANSAVLYPNILGGKMKEVWELERRRRETEATKREFDASHEEGEMLA
ncbi:hypothetical protein VKT23_004217 [Stygiomarasmius scandens]|uniref:INO80 complex subunit B-like conserved region domain-containing protein n=1 Tax=Marasmiellus scandens TaxID=2682957 RepID=A0ABR1JV03_9AGAR